MPQLDKFTYFTQFFWSCLFLFTFYIPICNDGDGVLGISRILKLRNQLVSPRGNNILRKDPNSLEDISRKGFSRRKKKKLMMSIYLSRSFPRSNSSFLLCSGNASPFFFGHRRTRFIFIISLRFLFIGTVSFILYLLCLRLGSMDFFHDLLSKMGGALGRVLLSRGLGCEGWLVLILLAAFGFCEEPITIMKMVGNETGPHRGDASPSSTENEADSGSWKKYLNFSSFSDESESSTAQKTGHQPTSDRPVQPQPPAAENPGEAVPEPSRWSGSWIGKWFHPEGSSSAPNEGEHEVTSPQPGPSNPAPPVGEAAPLLGHDMAPSGASGSASRSSCTGFLRELFDYETTDDDTSSVSVNRPEGQPRANPVAPRGEEAGPPNQPPRVVPYPYQPDEVIGGDSVNSIEGRLLAKYSFPSSEVIRMARIQAEDLFEVKVEIIRLMAGLDPTGDWMGRGARALDNPRTATGEESLERLYNKWEDLSRGGVRSKTFWEFKSRICLRQIDPPQNSST